MLGVSIAKKPLFGLTKVLITVTHKPGNSQGTAVNTGFTGSQPVCDHADMDKSYSAVHVSPLLPLSFVLYIYICIYLDRANQIVKSHQ
jgi:hypothetical protein